MARLKDIAAEIKETGITLNEAQEKHHLSPTQKSHVKSYLHGCPEALRNKTKKDIEDELELHLKAFKEMEAKKEPRPLKRICIRGKWYIDITPEFIDCGG